MRATSQRSAATLRGRARAASPADVTGDCGCGCGGTCGGTRGHAPRASAGGVTGRQPSVKDMFITDFRSPDSVQPGQALDLAVTIGNGALARVFDPDDCTNGANPCRGGIVAHPAATCLQVEFQVGGSQQITDPDCLGGTEFGAKERDYRTTFTAPNDEGDYTVSATLVLPGSGRRAGPLTDTITVTAEAPTRPGNGGGNGGNGNGEDGIPLSLLALATVGVVGGVAVTNLG